jgi:hypothetical protein
MKSVGVINSEVFMVDRRTGQHASRTQLREIHPFAVIDPEVFMVDRDWHCQPGPTAASIPSTRSLYVVVGQVAAELASS